jgi:hypothetical protein
MFAGDSSDPSDMMNFVKEGVPALISYKVAVNTSRKLISGEGERKKGDEVHILSL